MNVVTALQNCRGLAVCVLKIICQWREYCAKTFYTDTHWSCLSCDAFAHSYMGSFSLFEIFFARKKGWERRKIVMDDV